MSVPSAHDLFINVWCSKINSEEFAQPGDTEWDQKKQNNFWGQVWLECKSLSLHLNRINDMNEQAQAAFTREPEKEAAANTAVDELVAELSLIK